MKLSETDKKAFTELMKKGIGENYTRVANDIINGTTSELTAPIKETAKHSLNWN